MNKSKQLFINVIRRDVFKECDAYKGSRPFSASWGQSLHVVGCDCDELEAKPSMLLTLLLPDDKQNIKKDKESKYRSFQAYDDDDDDDSDDTTPAHLPASN